MDDNSRINSALDWLLGYLSASNPHLPILMELFEKEDLFVDVEIQDSIAEQIRKKFGHLDDRKISMLVVVAFGLGGPE